MSTAVATFLGLDRSQLALLDPKSAVAVSTAVATFLGLAQPQSAFLDPKDAASASA